MTFEHQLSKVVRVEVSVGNDDAGRSIEQLAEDIKRALKRTPVKAKGVTVQGSYYIVDGKVCLPGDYDPATQDRKPGTHPPVWAGGPVPSNVRSPIPDVVEDKPREIVMVKPTRSNERHPDGRRVRSDKGKPRGKRTPKEAEA